MNRLRFILPTILLSFLTACVAPREHRVVDSRYASGSIPAIKQLGNTKKPVSLEQMGRLIDQLESDDPAVRVFAIEALQKLTGSAQDYDYYDADTNRAKAVEAWRAWLNAQPDPFVPVSAR